MSANPVVKIYVATHKQFEMPTQSTIYCPVLGGASLYPDLDFGYQKDNVGENISEKKEWYNELSVLYWAWKNSDADIKGLCHYRRFFYTSDTSIAGKYILDRQSIIDSLREYDIILPVPYIHKGISVYDAYSRSGKGLQADLDLAREIVGEMYPAYMPAFDTVMKRDWASLCNALVARKDVFDQYADWLFSVLFELEGRISFEHRDAQQIRVMGFLGERLLNVWVEHHRLRVEYYRLHRTDAPKNLSYYIHIAAEKAGLYKLFHMGRYYIEKHADQQ